MKTKIKPKICKYQEKTISFHPSTLSNFFYPTPLKLHKTFSQHLNFKNGQNTTIISHQSESSHILKCTYTHPPSTSHPSFRRRSLLLTPHAPPYQQHHASAQSTNKTRAGLIYQTTTISAPQFSYVDQQYKLTLTRYVNGNHRNTNTSHTAPIYPTKKTTHKPQKRCDQTIALKTQNTTTFTPNMITVHILS